MNATTASFACFNFAPDMLLLRSLNMTAASGTSPDELRKANEMARRDARFGLVSICAAGAMAGAMILERPSALDKQA